MSKKLLGGAVPSARGMSLRDYFAGQALSGIVGASATKEVAKNISDARVGEETRVELVATACYNYADAMLRARDEK